MVEKRNSIRSVEGNLIEVHTIPGTTEKCTWDCPHSLESDCPKDEEGRCPENCPYMRISAR